MTEYKHPSLSFGKLIYGSRDHFPQLIGLYRSIRDSIVAACNTFVIQIGEIVQRLFIGSLPKIIHTSVYSDPPQPSIKGGTVPQLVQRSEDLDEHLLGDVIGVLAVVSEAVSQIVDVPVASINYFVESAGVAALETFHQRDTLDMRYTVKAYRCQSIFPLVGDGFDPSCLRRTDSINNEQLLIANCGMVHD